MKHKHLKIQVFSLGLLSGVALAGGLAFKKINKDDQKVIVSENRLQYKWYPPQTPKSMSFAGESVPLERWDVRESLERELMIKYYMHGSTLQIIRLSSRYFPLIEERLRANGIPDDFKYLCVAESSLQMLAVSNVGAQGPWQFMNATGPEYGLEVNKEVDERYHVAKATDAACKYLKQAYNKLGSWTAAAASYNCGMGGYSSRARVQQTSNFYDMAFVEETARYIYRILALKYLITGAEQLGYIVQGNDAYKPVPTRSITVTESIPDLAAWSIRQGSNYKMLKLLNPWLRANTLTISKGNSYEIELPRS